MNAQLAPYHQTDVPFKAIYYHLDLQTLGSDWVCCLAASVAVSN